MYGTADGEEVCRRAVLLRLIHQAHDGIEVLLPVHECFAVDSQYRHVDAVLWCFLGWFNRRTNLGQLSMRAGLAEEYLPPDVVDDTCLYVLEPIRVTEELYHGGGTETVSCYSHLVDVKPILPLLPVDPIQTPRRPANKAFTPQVLTSNFFAVASCDLLEYVVSFLEFTQP